jgi:DUF2971 family protein
MKLFKYFGDYGLHVLRDLEIYLSPANEFNDPFEFSINFDNTNITIEDVKRVLRKDEYFREWCQLNPSEEDPDKRHRDYLSHLPEIAEARISNLPARKELTEKTFQSDVSKGFIIGCFSMVDDSILMWSHYSRGHTGIVIEFDPSSEPFNIPPCLQIVKYCSLKPVYQHGWQEGDVHMQEAFFPIASHKADVWSYEKEVRFIIPNTVSIIRDGRFLKIPAKSIMSVTLGFRRPIENKVAINRILQRADLKHVVLKSAYESIDGYGIEIQELPND